MLTIVMAVGCVAAFALSVIYLRRAVFWGIVWAKQFLYFVRKCQAYFAR